MQPGICFVTLSLESVVRVVYALTTYKYTVEVTSSEMYGIFNLHKCVVVHLLRVCINYSKQFRERWWFTS